MYKLLYFDIRAGEGFMLVHLHPIFHDTPACASGLNERVVCTSFTYPTVLYTVHYTTTAKTIFNMPVHTLYMRLPTWNSTCYATNTICSDCRKCYAISYTHPLAKPNKYPPVQQPSLLACTHAAKKTYL